MAALEDIWQDDTLGRRHDGDTVYRFLMGQIEARRARGAVASYVLNIDAAWGHGKSYFLDRFATQLELSGHVVARVNAWENDLTNEPMIAVMAAIEDALKDHLSTPSKVQRKWKALVKSSGPLAVSLVRGVATSLLKKHTDTFLEDVGDALNGEPMSTTASEDADDSAIGEGVAAVVENLGDDFASGLIEAHKQQLNSIKTFRANLASMSASLRESMGTDSLIFILVDELDRCRPSHAIDLLEAVKHLFNTDGIVFVVATNTDQLSASVKAVYGNDFNAKTYLLRFFDRTFRFRDAEPKIFIGHLFKLHGIDPAPLSRFQMDSIELSAAYFSIFDMSLRDIEQCFEIFATVHTLWESKVPLQLPLLWPMICMYHTGREQAFELLCGQPSRAEIDSVFPTNRILLSQKEHDLPRREIVTKSIEAKGLTQCFMSGFTKPLHNLVDASTGSLARRAAADYFAAELSQLHGNRYNPADPPYSVIRQYRDLVKLAVQFKQSEPTDAL